jgi:HMG (high mobility group) box
LRHSASPLQHRPEASSATTTDAQCRSFLNVASEKWKNLDPIMKAKYDRLANQEKERYESELTQWEMVQGTPKHRRQPSLHSSQMDVSSREEIEDQKLSSLSVSRGRFDAFVAPCWLESTTDNQQQASLFSQTLPTLTKYANQSRRNSDSAMRAEVIATVPQYTHSLYPGTFSDVSESSFRPYDRTHGTTDRERIQCEFQLE